MWQRKIERPVYLTLNKIIYVVSNLHLEIYVSSVNIGMEFSWSTLHSGLDKKCCMLCLQRILPVP